MMLDIFHCTINYLKTIRTLIKKEVGANCFRKHPLFSLYAMYTNTRVDILTIIGDVCEIFDQLFLVISLFNVVIFGHFFFYFRTNLFAMNKSKSYIHATPLRGEIIAERRNI